MGEQQVQKVKNLVNILPFMSYTNMYM